MTGVALAGVLVAALAGACLPADPPAARLHRLGRPSRAAPDGHPTLRRRSNVTPNAERRQSAALPERRRRQGLPPLRRTPALPHVAVGAICWLGSLLATGSVAAAATAGAAGAGCVLVVRAQRRRRSVARWRAVLIELCEALSAELRGGASARDALAAATQGAVELAPLALAAEKAHGDVAATLRALAAAPGGGGLRRLEVCWVVCERSGSSLAGPVARLTAALRDDEQVRREVAAQLAGPRSTGLLLAALPLFGIAMGSALGARPLDLLFGTPVGLACLLAGGSLEGLGLYWLARITGRAEPP